MHARAVLPAALLAALVLVTGCETNASPSPGSSTPVVRPTTDRVADDYRSQLKASAELLNEALSGIDRARSKAALVAALEDSKLALTSTRIELARIAVPPSATREHAGLTSALSILMNDVDELERVVEDDVACSASSALSYLRTLPAQQAIADASDALRARGFDAVVAIPKPPIQTGTRPPNGAQLSRPTRVQPAGGVLRVRNDKPDDVVVTIAQNGEAVRAVYARQGMTVTMQEIPDGTYQLTVATGQQWDPLAHTFSKNCALLPYPEKLVFDQRTANGEREVTSYDIQLVASSSGR